MGYIKIFKRGYKLTWIIKVSRQRTVARNPTISLLASNIPDKEVQGLLEKGAILSWATKRAVFNSYFAVPKSKRTPDEWRQILNLKKLNKYICHIPFEMEELKMVRTWF